MESGQVRKIMAIEGLRGWLAWSVVLCHLIFFSGIDEGDRYWHMVRRLGDGAVIMFVILSGFVITSMLLEKKESWTRYMVRRTFRLFPAYLIALAFGAAATVIAAKALHGTSPTTEHDALTAATIASLAAHPLLHITLHLLLLQGVVSIGLLPGSEIVFLPPSWSLSLEWQFYLIAPALVFALVSRWRALAIAIIVCGAVLYKAGIFGTYAEPSMFFGAGIFFLVGIASRLISPHLSAKALSLSVLVLVLVYVAGIATDVREICLWLVFLMFITRQPGGGLVDRVGRAALESKRATALGARSYSTYLIHYPIIQALFYLLLPLRHFTRLETLVIIGMPAVALTLLCSDLMYRYVERPMVRYGAMLLTRPNST